MDSTEVAFAGVAGQAALVRSGELSARELTALVLERIRRLDPALRAFTTVLDDRALAEADARDRERAAGADLPLLGVPVAVKDEQDVAGVVTTFGGSANTRPAAADSEVVRRLRAAGAVVVGKTALPEFGQWPFAESTRYGCVRNPWDPERTPGGSSAGSAAAVAAGMVALATAGDAGGSIRIPSACCGVFGLKPARGRVSTAPMAHLWHALGTVGALTRTAEDSALVHDVLAGSTPTDRWQAPPLRTTLRSAPETSRGRLRIGWSTASAVIGRRADPLDVQALRQAADRLAALGHDVREVDPRLPDVTGAFVPQFYGGVRAEARLVERPRRLERRTRHTVRMSRVFPDRVVERAVRRGERIGRRVDEVFDDLDLLLSPVLATRPGPVGALDGAGSLEAQLRALPMIAYTALWNVTGHPAASVPVGIAADGMPLSVQVVGRRDAEPTILAVGAQLQSPHRPPV